MLVRAGRGGREQAPAEWSNMMRYQRLSPECLPLPNGRKPPATATTTVTATATTFKENTHHNHNHHHHDGGGGNGRIPTFPLRVRSAPNQTSTATTSDHHHYPISAPEPTAAAKPNVTTVAAAVVETTLPHWGRNKRSRGSRADSRPSADDVPGHRRNPHHHPSKIQRRSVTIPPFSAAGHHRASNSNANSRSCAAAPAAAARHSGAVLPSRLSSGRFGNRTAPLHLTAKPGTWRSDPPLSRPEKRSALEKMHNKSSSAISYVHNHHHHNHHQQQQSHHHSSESLNPSSAAPPASSKKEAVGSGSTTVPSTVAATTEKLNLDLFEWPRIYLSLSRKEKEDDFLVMKGTKLPQRPKKRAKNIDKTLQYCLPGMWLSDLTRGRYEVREKRCVKKKKRGLKAMESMDSDSD